MDNDNKIEIILNLLNERYNSSHKMRERSQSFAVWIAGLGIALIWILINGTNLNILQRFLVSILTIGLGGLSIYFISAIQRGFNNNREITIKLEKLLGCYKKNEYIEDDRLFPEEYKSKNKLWSNHFSTLYSWIICVLLIVIVFIWNNPGKANTTAKIDHPVKEISQKELKK
ncbi:MAG: hypothetical protein KAS32_30880 [Candidatus Peribacteraceae bacterium]|nr:hypothetical protein [Candidatus Peribacteraceae bacterium]